MHIPDGFLDTKTVVATGALSLLGLSTAVRRMKRQMQPGSVPLMGLAAAFVFAAQMLNFPVGGGTSGHLLGAVLLGVLLGPGAAILVMTSVLIVQCFLFADGGILSLGANIFNMAIVASLTGYALYRTVRRIVPGVQGQLLAVAFASWCSTVLASITCAGELVWSGLAPWGAVFPAMANVHMVIGLGEGLITTLVVASVLKTRPDLLEKRPSPAGQGRTWEMTLYGATAVAGMILFILPFASPLPDGLVRVAAVLGFQQNALRTSILASPMGGFSSAVTATLVAGAVGAVAVFLLSFVLARLLVRKPGMPGTQEEEEEERRAA